MRAYVKKIQSKPEDVRKQILVGSLVVAMFFVGTIGIYGVKSRMTARQTESRVVDVAEPSPFTLFRNSISNTYDSISASVANAPLLKDKSEQLGNVMVVEE